MSEMGDAFEAIIGLVIGGLIFIAFGSALSQTTLDSSSAFVNFELWGVIYILGGVVLGVVFVIGVLMSLFNNL